MVFYEDRKAEIGRRIKKERENANIKPKRFLEKLCLSAQSTKTLSAWERGEKLPSLDNLAQMADLFDCDIGYLLCDFDERKRNYADVCQLTGLSENAVEALELLVSRPKQKNDYTSIINHATISFLNRELGQYTVKDNTDNDGDSLPIYTLFLMLEQYIYSDHVRFRAHPNEITAGQYVFFDTGPVLGLPSDSQMDFGDSAELYRQSLLNKVRDRLEDMRKQVQEDNQNG